MTLKLKVLSVFAAFTLLVGVAVPATNALTADQLKAILLAAGLTEEQASSLAIALSASIGGTPVVSTQFTTDLTIGSTGAQVVALQDKLIAGGYLTMPVGVSKGYFGPLTQSAVASWQAANGIAPAVGYFGPISRAKANQSVTPTTPTTPTTPSTGLNGTTGDIISSTKLTQYANETVAEGANSKVVAGIELEADTSGDVRLQNVRLTLSQTESNASKRLDRYVDSVEVWFDGQMVGMVDVEDFSRSGDEYSAIVSLDSSSIIRMDSEGELLVAFNARNSIDSTDRTNAEWLVEMENIRFTDPSGAILTYDPGANGDFDDILFGTAASADNVEFRVSLNSSNPKAQSIGVDETNTTQDVTILAFDAEARNGDMELRSLDVELEIGTADVDEVVSRVSLYRGNTLVESIIPTTANATGTVSFDDIELDMDEGDNIGMSIRVDLKKLDGVNYNEGETIQASISSTELGTSVVEDTNGNILSDKTGSAVGDTHTLLTEGIDVNLVSSNPDTNTDNNGDIVSATLTIVYEVTAFGDTIFVPQTLARGTTSAGTALGFTVLDSDNDVIGLPTVTSTQVLTSNAPIESSMYRVDDGQTRTFTATINLSAATNGFYRIQLDGAGYATSAAGTVNDLQLLPTEDFRTGSVLINNN